MWPSWTSHITPIRLNKRSEFEWRNFKWRKNSNPLMTKLSLRIFLHRVNWWKSNWGRKHLQSFDASRQVSHAWPTKPTLNLLVCHSSEIKNRGQSTVVDACKSTFTSWPKMKEEWRSNHPTPTPFYHPISFSFCPLMRTNGHFWFIIHEISLNN